MPNLRLGGRTGMVLLPAEPVTETRPVSLVGAADFLKDLYVREGTMTRDQTLILLNLLTGEMDVSTGTASEGRPRQYASKSKMAEARNRARREKYEKGRDKPNLPKSPVVSQQVMKTKSGN